MLSDQELAVLLEAARAEKPGCSCDPQLAHARDCQAASWFAKRSNAISRLRDLAPDLAQEVLDQRAVGQALAEALREHAGCACWCNADDRALARWAELAETEVPDGLL